MQRFYRRWAPLRTISALPASIDATVKHARKLLRRQTKDVELASKKNGEGSKTVQPARLKLLELLVERSKRRA